MIQKVIIENFQSHKKTEIDFIPGTNVIIGASDSGKSAIFRAIQWVCTNRPLGDAFRSVWGGDTKVSIHTEEGDIITRVKTSTKNTYSVNGKELKAFKYDIPEEVLDVLHIDEYSIQSQMDIPFLLAYSPGEATQLLNKASNIEDIDYAISNIRKMYKTLENKKTHMEETLEQYEEEIKEYQDLEQIENRVKEASRLEKIIKAKETTVYRLKQIIAEIKDIEGSLKKTEYIEKIDILKAEKIYSKLTKKQRENETLKKLIDNIYITKKEIETTEYVDKTIKQVYAMGEKWDEVKGRGTKIKEIQNIISKVEELTSKRSKIEEGIKTLTERFKRIQPKICPLCNTEIKGEII